MFRLGNCRSSFRNRWIKKKTATPKNSVKGYLCYKTTENLSYEVQVKNFFMSEESYLPFSRYSSFYIFNHPMIYEFCDVMIRIST